MNAETTTAGAARYAGTRVAWVEDARLLTGHGTYVDDIALPGMLHACFVRSPFARAAIRGIDTAAARALPGVRAVFTAADLNPRRQGAVAHRRSGRASPETPRPPLADDEVRFVGDPVVLVVAESLYVAEDAAELVDVDYEPLAAVVDYTTAGAATRRSSTRATVPTSSARSAACPPRRSTTCSPEPPTWRATRSSSRRTHRCRWRDAASIVDHCRVDR